jgi:hypothetical protein
MPWAVSPALAKIVSHDAMTFVINGDGQQVFSRQPDGAGQHA